MNSFTKINKSICIISLICFIILSIVLAINFSLEKDMSSQISDWITHEDSYNRYEEHFNAGKFFLVLFGCLLLTAVVHSFWGMFISVTEDIHSILYLAESTKTDKEPGNQPALPEERLKPKETVQSQAQTQSSSNSSWYCRNCGEKIPATLSIVSNAGYIDNNIRIPIVLQIVII